MRFIYMTLRRMPVIIVCPCTLMGMCEILLNADQGGRVPAGCTLETATIDGREIRVYVAGGLSAQDAKEYVVYSMDEDGVTDYYRYDVQSGTMGYYMDDFESGEESETSSDSEESMVPVVNSAGNAGNDGSTLERPSAIYTLYPDRADSPDADSDHCDYSAGAFLSEEKTERR